MPFDRQIPAVTLGPLGFHALGPVRGRVRVRVRVRVRGISRYPVV